MANAETWTDAWWLQGLELAEPRASERVILEVGQGGEEKVGAQVLGCRAKASALPLALPGFPSASTSRTVSPPTHPLHIPKDLPSGRAVFSGDAEGEAKRKTGGRRGQLHPPPPLGTPAPPTDPQVSAGPRLPLSFAGPPPAGPRPLSAPTSLLGQTLRGLQGQIQTLPLPLMQLFPKRKEGVGFDYLRAWALPICSPSSPRSAPPP